MALLGDLEGQKRQFDALKPLEEQQEAGGDVQARCCSSGAAGLETCLLTAAVCPQLLFSLPDKQEVAHKFRAGDLVQYVKAVLHAQNPELPMSMVSSRVGSLLTVLGVDRPARVHSHLSSRAGP